MPVPQSAYQLTCVKTGYNTGCGWVGHFYFDDPIPRACPKCNRGYHLKLSTIHTTPIDVAQESVTVPAEAVRDLVDEPVSEDYDLPF